MNKLFKRMRGHAYIVSQRERKKFAEGIYIGRKQFAYNIAQLCSPLEPKDFEMSAKDIPIVQEMIEIELKRGDSE